MFAVAFSPDGKTLAATGADGVSYLWTDGWKNVQFADRFTLAWWDTRANFV